MNWLRENWFWIVVFGLFTWVHLKMHGGHGHHGHGGPHPGGSGYSRQGGTAPEGGVEHPSRPERRKEENHAGY